MQAPSLVPNDGAPASGNTEGSRIGTSTAAAVSADPEPSSQGMFTLVNQKLSDVQLNQPPPMADAEDPHVEEAKEVPAAAAGTGLSAAESFISSKTFNSNSDQEPLQAEG